jgi:hypothetical protein
VVDDGVLDEALERLGRFGPEFGGGLSNHGPMAVEALVRLGRADAVVDWVDAYVGRLEEPVAPSDRPPELGDMATVRDWELRFAAELADAEWSEVVRTWVPRLAPGLMAAATHGWLRTAHATRSLRSRETPQRLSELARGLAYWAARYQEIPGPLRPTGGADVATAMATLPAHRPLGSGLIVEAVTATLSADGFFVAAVDAVDSASLDVDSLMVAASSAILAGGAGDPIVYVHTLTPTAAIRTVSGLLDTADDELVLGSAWRTVAALVSTYRLAPVAGFDVGDVDAGGIVDRAVTGGDEHAIKVAEAAFGPDASTDPTVRAAAAALVARLSG